MRALVWDGGLRLEPDRPVPARPPGCALIRVRLAGVCHTDIELTRGYMGFSGILGHEFVGEVVEADVPGLAGQRVVGEITIPCGECDLCGRGLRGHCRHARVLGIAGWDGAFADYLVLPEANLHRVPPAVPDERAVFTEPLAAALEILQQVAVRPADRVAVVGDGRLGLLCAQALALSGARVRVVGKHRRKLALLDGQGIETALAGELEAGDQGRWDVVVECTGRPGGLAVAAGLVRPRGTLVLKTTIQQEISLDLAPLVVREVALVGSRCGPFAPALRLLERGTVCPEALVEEVFPLEEAVLAMERARQPGTLKVLIRPAV